MTSFLAHRRLDASTHGQPIVNDIHSNIRQFLSEAFSLVFLGWRAFASTSFILNCCYAVPLHRFHRIAKSISLFISFPTTGSAILPWSSSICC
jgi:hypothetical protein